MTASVLVAEGLTKVFTTRKRELVVIEGLDLEVREGEFICLVGGSGSGKTTLLNIFAGFLRPSAGAVYLRGKPIDGIEPRCGMVFQSYALFPWKTVRGNVAFGLKMQGVPARDRERRARHFIEMVGLKGFESHYPAELSGGMQQRVTFARLLAANPEIFLMDEPFAANPEIFLMDEPFAALDALTRQVMQEELIRIHESNGKTTVFVTHNIDEALLLSDRIALLSARPGRVKRIIDNPLPRPRRSEVQLTPEYLRMKAEIWNLVQEEVRRQIELIE